MRRISYIGILLLLFLLTRTFELFMTHSPWFDLKAVNISGNEELNRDEILKLSQLRLKRNIFGFNLKDIEKRIEKDKRVKSAEVKRVLPGEIQIKLEEKKPDLLVNLNPFLKLYGLSAEGEIIPLRENCSYDLPLINGVRSKNFKPYSRIEDTGLQTALSFYEMIKEECPKFLGKISEINLEDEDNLVVILVETGTKVFFGAGDLEEKFKRFIWINKDLVFEGCSALDLRFKDQVIFKGLKETL